MWAQRWMWGISPSGFLDIENIVAALQRVAFDGVILFEIIEPDFAVAAAESVQRLQQAMAALEQPQLIKEQIS